jgi:hypothetical protein
MAKGGSQTVVNRISSFTNGCANSLLNSLDVPYDKKKHEEGLIILEFKDNKCVYCQKNDATQKDHYKALIKDKEPSGYGACAVNMLPCCQICNPSKGNKDLSKWRKDISEQERFKNFEKFHQENALKFTYNKEVFQEILDEVVIFMTEIHLRLPNECKPELVKPKMKTS